jgi:hypothetical protein
MQSHPREGAHPGLSIQTDPYKGHASSTTRPISFDQEQDLSCPYTTSRKGQEHVLVIMAKSPDLRYVELF